MSRLVCSFDKETRLKELLGLLTKSVRGGNAKEPFHRHGSSGDTMKSFLLARECSKEK